MEQIVFISYSSKDTRLAEELDGILRGSGFDTWFAPRDVRSGSAFPERIQEGIQRSALLVVLVTVGANSSRHVALELNLAVGMGKKILPLRIDQVATSGALTYFLGLSQWLDVQRPLAGFSDELVGEITRILEGSGSVERTGTTRRGFVSSVAQIHAQRDAMVLGSCMATVLIAHHGRHREVSPTFLSQLARRAQLVTSRLGVGYPDLLFDPAFVADVEGARDVIATVARAVDRLRIELEIRHDRRAAHALVLSHRVRSTAIFVGRLAAPELDVAVRAWGELATDVELPRVLLSELVDRVRDGRDPSSACLEFGDRASLSLDDRLLQETTFARYRASVWEMGCAITLAAVGRASGAQAGNVEGLVDKAMLHEQVLALRPPRLPDLTGNSADDHAAALHYMWRTLAEAFVDDIRSLYGQRTAALLDAAVKSANLFVLYSDDTSEYNAPLADGIERSLHKAAIPTDLWSNLVTAIRQHARFGSVKDLAFQVRQDVGRYLADLVVASRISPSTTAQR